MISSKIRGHLSLSGARHPLAKPLRGIPVVGRWAMVFWPHRNGRGSCPTTKAYATITTVCPATRQTYRDGYSDDAPPGNRVQRSAISYAEYRRLNCYCILLTRKSYRLNFFSLYNRFYYVVVGRLLLSKLNIF